MVQNGRPIRGKQDTNATHQSMFNLFKAQRSIKSQMPPTKIAYESTFEERKQHGEDETRTRVDKPSMKSQDGGAEKAKTTENEDKLFFPISKIKFNDLHDFSQRDSDNDKMKIRRIGATQIKKETGELIHHNEKNIALFRYGETVYAIDEKCPHVGGPLHLGDIETISGSNVLCIVCPWHKWKIELKSGKLKFPQRQRQVEIYPVQVTDEGDLLIGFNEFSPAYFDGFAEF